MRFETITFVYNEEFLLPYYLEHYKWCDRLNIIYDTDSTDNTLRILKSNPLVNVIPFTFENGMDDIKKVNFINYIYKLISADYILNIDVDEFIFMDKEKDLNDLPVVNARLGNVYRNINDTDLDISLPIKQQRRHGVFDPMYNKPIIVKAGLPIHWLPGNHVIQGEIGAHLGIFGAHWANADPCFCVNRRVKNRALRQSKVNIDNRLTVQHHGITEADVLRECKEHLHDVSLW